MLQIRVEIADARRAMNENRAVCGKLPRLPPLQNGLHGCCHYLLRTQTRTPSSKKPFGDGTRFDVFSRASNRFSPLTDEALRLPAELWAKARRKGGQLRIQKNSTSMVFSLRGELRFNGNTPRSVRTARCRETKSGTFGVTRRPSAVRRLGH